MCKDKYIPIYHEPNEPPLGTLNFLSDVSGFSNNSIRTPDIGCGLIGTNVDEDTILGYQLWWSKHLITKAKNIHNKRFGNKIATLEMVALVLPFLLSKLTEKLPHLHFDRQHVTCFQDERWLCKG
jgi:hypothetical protein